MWSAWIISVFLLPLAISVAGQLIVLSQVRALANDLQRGILEEVRSRLDGILVALDQAATSAAASPHLLRVIGVREFDEGESIYAARQLILDLNRFATSESVASIYVFFRESGIIVSNTAIYEPSLFFETAGVDSEIDLREWMGLLMTIRRKQVFRTWHGRTMTLASVVPVPTLGAGRVATATVVAVQNPQTMLATRQRSSAPGEVYVRLESGRVLPVSQSQTLTAVLEEEDALPEILSIEGSRWLVSTTPSSSASLYYVHAIPVDESLAPVRRPARYSMALLVVCLALGSLLVHRVSGLIYRPVADLVRDIVGPPSDEVDRNEFSRIRSAIEDVERREIQLRVALADIDRSSLHGPVIQLLRGSNDERARARAELDRIGTRFYQGVYVVIVVKPYVTARNTTELSLQDLQRTVKDHFEEVLDRTIVAACPMIEGIVVAILNGPDSMTVETGGELVRAATALTRRIADAHSIECVVAMSGTHHADQELPAAYDEATLMLEKTFLTAEPVAVFTTPSRPVFGAEIDRTGFRDLCSRIWRTECDSAVDLLCSIVDEIRANTTTAARLALFDLASTIYRTFPEECANALASSGADLAVTVLNSRHILEAHQLLEALVRDLCIGTDRARSSHNTTLLTRADALIARQYADANLSLLGVADQLGVSPGYLSSFYKKQTGEAFHDAVREKRVRVAATSLRNSNDSIHAIGRAIGYPSVHTFIRAFKKSTGLTPGRYRDLNTLEKE